MENQAPQPQTIIIPKQGNGIGIGGAVLGLGALVGLFFVGKNYLAQKNKDQSELDLDTPAGAIVLQLKTVFDSFPVNDKEYKRVALLITPDIKDDVYKLYRKNTGRNLSDDIAKHITAGTQAVTAKQEVINNTTGSLIKITSDDKIAFNVGKGSIVRFEAGSKIAIPLYEKPEGVLPDGILSTKIKPFYTLQPTAIQFLVTDVKEVNFDSLKLADGWTKFFKPLVRTRKVYAAVQIGIPLQANAQGVKRVVKLWADARMFRMGKGTNYLKGLPKQTNLSLLV